MSSQILVYGYIEMPEGTADDNAKVLDRISVADGDRYGSLARTFGPLQSGFESVMCSFAGSFKRTDGDDCQRFEGEFERILKQLKFVTAHVSIDDFGADEASQSIDYAFSPARHDGPFVLKRARATRTPGEPEEVT
jgi:hypothetical protein